MEEKNTPVADNMDMDINPRWFQTYPVCTSAIPEPKPTAEGTEKLDAELKEQKDKCLRLSRGIRKL